MEKKMYIAPAVEVIDFEATQMLCASPDLGVTDTPTDENADLANDRRGSWGSLWDN